MSDLRDLLLDSTGEMIYISESDYPLEVVCWEAGELQGASSLARFLQEQAGLDADASAEEVDFEAFFVPLTEEQDWFGDDERADQARYIRLKALLKAHLQDLRVLKFGEIEKTLYIVGRTPEGAACGVRTISVET